MHRHLRVVSATCFAIAFASAFFSARLEATELVPFVGCASDGQLGPVPPPKGQPKAIDVNPAVARELAYYQAEGSFGVLAPKGWNCFYFYGSNGASLVVSPDKNLKSGLTAKLSGAAVTETVDVGDTSGRFDVAKYSARLFPRQERAFIASVIAEGIEPKKDFPFGAYPADKLTYKTPLLVEFSTPANREGLGTSDRLQKNAQPIYGMAKLEGSANEPNFILLAVRLPANPVDLEKTIVNYSE